MKRRQHQRGLGQRPDGHLAARAHAPERAARCRGRPSASAKRPRARRPTSSRMPPAASSGGGREDGRDERGRGDGAREVDARPGHEDPGRGRRSGRAPCAGAWRGRSSPAGGGGPWRSWKAAFIFLMSPRRSGASSRKPAACSGREGASSGLVDSPATSQPEQQDDAEDQHVGEVGVEATGLDHPHPLRRAQHARA